MKCPPMGRDVTVSNVPACKGKIGYHLVWGENSRELAHRLIEVLVPVPIEAGRVRWRMTAFE